MGWEAWVAIVGGVLGAAGIGSALWAAKRWGSGRRGSGGTLGGGTGGGAGPGAQATAGLEAVSEPLRLAIVVNMTKSSASGIAEAAAAIGRLKGYGEPVVFETTAAEPGTAQARAAVTGGADLVLAAGGDGTVRAVAGALAGTETPMGILPIGTGNLFARNLALPLQRRETMLATAFGEATRRVDMGRLTAYAPDGSLTLSDEPFLVIAGIGFDALMVADTDPQLKAKLGWPAYFVSGMGHLSGRRVKARIDTDGEVRSLSARAIMFGNAGTLPAGLRLAPAAALDDGLLDIVSLDTRAGLIGWASLATQVALQTLGLRTMPRFAAGRLWHSQARDAIVGADAPTLLQLDGELIGEVAALEVRVDPGALLVRAK